MGDPFRDSIAAYWESVDAGTVHIGGYVWVNGAEQRWECDDDCPHPSHEGEQL